MLISIYEKGLRIAYTDVGLSQPWILLEDINFSIQRYQR